MTARRPDPGLQLLICAIAASLAISSGACRRNSNSNLNANGGPASFNPNDPEQARRQAQSLIDQGKELYKNDQDEQAVEKFKQAISAYPTSGEAHLRLGMGYAALDKKDEAEDEYKKAIELFKKQVQSDTKDGDAFFYLGEAHSFLHQDEEAARSYRQATKLKPNDEEAFYQLGKAESKLANYDAATAAFQKALDLDPDDSRAADGLEDAKQGTQRIREGKKHAEDMLKKQQEEANANGNLNANSSRVPKPTPKQSPTKP